MSKFPAVKAGDHFECHTCGENHELVALQCVNRADEPAPEVLGFVCQGQFHLGAVEGKLIAERRADIDESEELSP